MVSRCPLRAAGVAHLLHPDVVLERSAQEDVVPAAVVERSRLDLGVRLLDGELLPVGVVLGVVKPRVVVLRVLALQLWQVLKRQVAERGVEVVYRIEHLVQPALVQPLVAAGEVVPVGAGQARCPGQVEAEFERTSLVGPALVVVRRRHAGRDTLERRRHRLGRQPLRRADIRPAEHPHVAIAPRLRSGPLDGVIPVIDLVDERVELAF